MLCLLLSVIDGHVAPFIGLCCTVRILPSVLRLCQAGEALWMVNGRYEMLTGRGSPSTPLTRSFPFFDFTHQRMGKILVFIVSLMPSLGNLVSEDFLEF